MLPLRFIREHEDLVRESLAARGDDAPLDELLRTDDRRRELLQTVERLRAQRNSISKQIGEAADQTARAALIEQARSISDRVDEIDPELVEVQARVDQFLLLIPALPHASVPRGDSDEDNPVLYVKGGRPAFGFGPRPHWELGERLGILDFPRAAKIAGSGFWLFKGAGAHLQRAQSGKNSANGEARW